MASGNSNVVPILEAIFSVPAATMLVAIVVLIIFLIIVFVPRANGGWRLRLGAHSIERGEIPIQKHAPESAPNEIGASETIEPSKNPKEIASDQQANEQDKRSPFIQMLMASDVEELEAAYKRYLDTKGLDERAVTWRSSLRIRLNVDGAVKELAELERANKNWVEPSYHLARHYQNIEEFDFAINHIDEALRRSHDEENTGRFTLWKADLLLEQEDAQAAIALIKSYHQTLGSDQNQKKSAAYQKLAEIYRHVGNDGDMANALEMALIFDPNDRDCRFQLAYKYASNKETELLAGHHYRILTSQGENPMAFNNYGAVLGSLGDKLGEIQAWKGGLNGDTDYPAGNLAIALAERGFLKEAEEYLRKLPEAQRSGVRARYAASYIEKKREESVEKGKKIKASGRQFHDFVVSALKTDDVLALMDDADKILGAWEASDKDWKVSFERNEKNEMKGCIESKTKKYALKITSLEWGFQATATETEHLISGLGLLFAGAHEPKEPYWAETYSRPEQFTMYIKAGMDNRLSVLRIEGDSVSEFSMSKLVS